MLQVLLVDDEPFITQGLTVLIDWEANGYEIVAIMTNGEEAYDYLKKRKVDLIIADIKMPKMSGIELLEKIRMEKISEAYFVILSGYSDFRFAKEALRYDCMDYLLKPVDKEEVTKLLHKISEMHQVSERMHQERKTSDRAYLDRMVISLLTEKYDQSHLDYVKKYVGIEDGEEITYVSIEIDTIAEADTDQGLEKQQIHKQLYQNCLHFLGEKESCRCIFDVVGQEGCYDIGFLYSDLLALKREVSKQQYFKDLWESVSRELSLPVVVLVGVRVKDISDLSESYRTTVVMRSHRIFKENSRIFFFDEILKKEEKGPVLLKESVDSLVQAIEKNDMAEIEKKTDQLYKQLGGLDAQAGLIELNINYLMFQLIHLAARHDDSVNQEEIVYSISKSVFQGVNKSRNHMKRFVREYGEYLSQLRKKIYKGILVQVEREIRENYADALTLKELSKKYYINSAYLGQIFQKRYGRPFREYLNKYRMEQAVQLLQYTDKKVYEIAEEVGHHDLNYFIDRFIQVNGCTPTKFRKRFREGK